MSLNHVKKAWFGYGDAWIAECKDGFHWDLMGFYKSLEKILVGDYRRRPENIMVKAQLF